MRPETEPPMLDQMDAPLSVDRIREVLAILPPRMSAGLAADPVAAADVALVRDYHRILEIHALASAGGVAVAREKVEARLHDTDPDLVAVDALPAGAALGTRRVAAVREDMHQAHAEDLQRLTSIDPAEEAAVAACRDEIEQTLAQLR